MNLKNKRIIVGVTGGIAAYKSCDLVSKLVKTGADIRVVMTESAQNFVSPTTFSALTGNPTSVHMFDSKESIPHIELVHSADLLVVVPATANIIGKMANGIADDLLSTMLLAASCPVFFAPAMNINMYKHPAVQNNIQKLRGYGVLIREPDEGYLACGTTGKGRLPSTEVLFNDICSILKENRDLEGYKVLVTAGGTQEPIDPVRYIGNRSSGKMGYSIAEIAKNKGAEVTLVTTLERELEVDKLVKVMTAQEMYKQVINLASQHDIIIMAAAVADYMPVEVKDQKIKKHEDQMLIKLKKTPDILANLGKIKDNMILVGFAAETENLEEYAMEKLKKKNLDFIIANDVSDSKIGFHSDYNQVSIFDCNGLVHKSERLPKLEIAKIIWDTILHNECFKNKQKKKE